MNITDYLKNNNYERKKAFAIHNVSNRELFSRHRPFINFIHCCGVVLMHYNVEYKNS